MPISVGSVEVDVIPTTRGIYQRLRDGLVPDATRAGEDAGDAAGRAFAPAMASSISSTVTDAIGQRIGEQIGNRIASQVRDSLRSGVTAGGRTSGPAASRAGDEAGGAFGRLFRARVEAAFRSLPRANVGADATGFNAEMDRLRARLESLSNKRIGIDVSAADAMAELDRIQARLVELGAGHTDVNVRMDTARAIAQLDEFRAEIARVDGQHVEVTTDADTGRAISSFGNLVTAAAAFGPAIIPVLPIVAAGLGGVAAAGIAAAVGIGGIAAVAIPAFHSISSALQLQKAAQAASNSSTSSGAATALQMAGAQQALASAVRNGAQQVASARDQVVQAERGVQDAEKALAQSQVAAKQAQEALTEARKAAAQQLQDLASQYANAQLSQRSAALQLTEAENALNAAKKDPKATKLQRAEAQLAYDQAKQQLADQTTATGRLKDQQAAAVKAGVKGTDVYKQAQDALSQAQDDVVAKSQAVVDARSAVAKAEQQVAQAQASAADSIASAQRQIAQVQQQAGASASAAGEAQRKYQQALANMSPATRATYDAFVRLRGAFSEWSKSLQPKVMPIFTRALDGIARILPGLTPFVLAAARAVGGLQDKLGKEVKAPWAKSLKDDLGKTVEPAIRGIGIAVGNIFKGAGGIVDAFLPHVDQAGKTVDGWTGKFAKWGTSLKGSPKFEGFIDYVKREAPIVGRAVGDIFGAIYRVVQAFAPIAGISLGLLSGIAAVIKLIPPSVLKALALGFVAVALGLKAAAIAQGLLNTAMELNPIGIVIAAIIALVVIFVYAWQNSETFRDIVKGVFSAIKAAVQATVDWFKNSFIPFFTKTIPDAFKWLVAWVKANWPLILGIITGPIGLAVWAITHYWGNIRDAFSSSWSWIKKNVLYPIRDFFTKTIPGWANSLSSHVVGAFDNMHKGVASAWGKLEDAAKKPINFVIGTVWNKGILKVWDKITGWIPGLPKMGKLPLLEQGGALPVQPGVFNRPTAIVGEGNPAHPEYVIPTDPKYRNRALGLLQQAGTQMLAGGGIIGTIGGVTSDIGSGAWSGLKGAYNFLKDPLAGLVKLLNPVMDKLKPLTSSTWGKVAAGIPKAAVNGLKKLVTSFGGKVAGAGDSGVHGTGAAAAQAFARNQLRAFGWAPNQMDPLIKLWNGESGWNYKALNASSGAYGIPQALPASKMASAGADWRSNPATQIRWGLNYIRQRYYTPQIAWNKWQERQPHWYDDGGYLQPGLNLAYNGTGRPEPVFTSQQTAGLVRLATAPPTGGGEFTGDLYLDSGEFLGKVRGEVQQGMTALATAFRAGRKG